MAAGYALYGSATMMVLALGKGTGVNGFMLDPVYALCKSGLITGENGCFSPRNQAFPGPILLVNLCTPPPPNSDSPYGSDVSV